MAFNCMPAADGPTLWTTSMHNTYQTRANQRLMICETTESLVGKEKLRINIFRINSVKKFNIYEILPKNIYLKHKNPDKGIWGKTPYKYTLYTFRNNAILYWVSGENCTRKKHSIFFKQQSSYKWKPPYTNNRKHQEHI